MYPKKMVLIVGVILLIALSMMILSLSSRRPYPAYGSGRVAISLVSPFQKMIIGTTRFLRSFWERYFFLTTVVDENERLRKELREALAQSHRFQETLMANERLQRLLKLSQQMQQPMIAAQVIGKDPSPWFQTILVDKGLSDGVERGSPAINPEGIVGLVVEASGHFSKVMLITDPNSALDAVVQNSRARGIIKGGTSGYCIFDYVLRKHDLNIGDTVISSGMDGVFPKGLPVGKVTNIVKQEAGIFQDVTLTPYVDFERLEEVLIVTTPEPSDPS